MAGRDSGFTHAVTAALALRASVRLLKSRGIRIVWTVHNLRPHKPNAPALQVGLYRWLAREADAVIVHTPYAAQLVRTRLGRSGPMYLARHGNYVGAYDNAQIDRKTLRVRYGFANADHVLLAFGQIRAYKRLLELVRDFEESAPASARLIIAGAPVDRDIARKLREIAATNSRLILLDRQVPESEVAELYAIADLAIFNYSEIFSSGALILAFSLGLAVLAPQQGTDELIGRPALFDWLESPFEVLDEALSVPYDMRRHAALTTAHAHDWADSARVHIQAYTGDSSSDNCVI
jgi:beta-1,4-mannosyltransferase